MGWIVRRRKSPALLYLESQGLDPAGAKGNTGKVLNMVKPMIMQPWK